MDPSAILLAKPSASTGVPTLTAKPSLGGHHALHAALMTPEQVVTCATSGKVDCDCRSALCSFDTPSLLKACRVSIGNFKQLHLPELPLLREDAEANGPPASCAKCHKAMPKGEAVLCQHGPGCHGVCLSCLDEHVRTHNPDLTDGLFPCVVKGCQHTWLPAQLAPVLSRDTLVYLVLRLHSDAAKANQDDKNRVEALKRVAADVKTDMAKRAEALAGVIRVIVANHGPPAGTEDPAEHHKAEVCRRVVGLLTSYHVDHPDLVKLALQKLEDAFARGELFCTRAQVEEALESPAAGFLVPGTVDAAIVDVTATYTPAPTVALQLVAGDVSSGPDWGPDALERARGMIRALVPDVLHHCANPRVAINGTRAIAAIAGRGVTFAGELFKAGAPRAVAAAMTCHPASLDVAEPAMKALTAFLGACAEDSSLSKAELGLHKIPHLALRAVANFGEESEPVCLGGLHLLATVSPGQPAPGTNDAVVLHVMTQALLRARSPGAGEEEGIKRAAQLLHFLGEWLAPDKSAAVPHRAYLFFEFGLFDVIKAVLQPEDGRSSARCAIFALRITDRVLQTKGLAGKRLLDGGAVGFLTAALHNHMGNNAAARGATRLAWRLSEDDTCSASDKLEHLGGGLEELVGAIVGHDNAPAGSKDVVEYGCRYAYNLLRLLPADDVADTVRLEAQRRLTEASAPLLSALGTKLETREPSALIHIFFLIFALRELEPKKLTEAMASSGIYDATTTWLKQRPSGTLHEPAFACLNAMHTLVFGREQRLPLTSSLLEALVHAVVDGGDDAFQLHLWWVTRFAAEAVRKASMTAEHPFPRTRSLLELLLSREPAACHRVLCASYALVTTWLGCVPQIHFRDQVLTLDADTLQDCTRVVSIADAVLDAMVRGGATYEKDIDLFLKRLSEAVFPGRPAADAYAALYVEAEICPTVIQAMAAFPASQDLVCRAICILERVPLLTEPSSGATVAAHMRRLPDALGLVLGSCKEGSPVTTRVWDLLGTLFARHIGGQMLASGELVCIRELFEAAMGRLVPTPAARVLDYDFLGAAVSFMNHLYKASSTSPLEDVHVLCGEAVERGLVPALLTHLADRAAPAEVVDALLSTLGRLSTPTTPGAGVRAARSFTDTVELAVLTISGAVTRVAADRSRLLACCSLIQQLLEYPAEHTTVRRAAFRLSGVEAALLQARAAHLEDEEVVAAIRSAIGLM